MCLPDFIEFKKIKKVDAVIGYRNWRLMFKEPTTLTSQYQDYKWIKVIDGPHKVTEENSGIYSYNNYYYNYYYNYYNNNNYNNNYYNYYYNSNYNNYIVGIILQYGRVAIHKTGYRSQYAKIKTLFTIREVDAAGDEKFKNWIKEFNSIINNLAVKYKVDTIHWQDFVESQENKK